MLTARPFTVVPSAVAAFVGSSARDAAPTRMPARRAAAHAAWPAPRSATFSGDVTRTVDLDHEQLTLFEGAAGMRVRVLYGTVWLTQSGVQRDAFLDGGAELALHGQGLVVAEGVGPARLLVSRPLSRVARGGALGLQALRRWALALLRRTD